MIIVVFVIILWYGGLFFQSFFLHRYAAHQVFTMSKPMERLTFMVEPQPIKGKQVFSFFRQMYIHKTVYLMQQQTFGGLLLTTQPLLIIYDD